MDKSFLVKHANEFIAHLENLGFEIDFAALIPKHFMFKNNNYRLVLSIPALEGMPDNQMIIIEKEFAFWPLDVRKYLSAITFTSADEAADFITERTEGYEEFTIPLFNKSVSVLA
jgi:hypothetical protein